MEKYKENFSKILADSGALFLKDNLFLKDGRNTPYFVNIGNFADKASLRWELANAYAGMIKQKMDNGMKIDIIFGPSYKASLIAGDTTLALLKNYNIDIGCCYDRKEAKTHGESSLKDSMFVGAKFYDGCNIYLIDDVGTSMATKFEGLEKIAHESKSLGIKTKVVEVGIAVDREQVGPVYDESKSKELSNKERVIHGVKGEDAIGNFVKKTGIPVDSIVGIREVIDYLFNLKHPLMINDKKQPLNSKIYNEFNKYMKLYGREKSK
ncbi:hypothetical protein KAT36_01830 [Candidatus Pacearchaeota archaeon]|nr:hypothetical protein [Candidatus Pacearchaeota archaeon]